MIRSGDRGSFGFSRESRLSLSLNHRGRPSLQRPLYQHGSYYKVASPHRRYSAGSCTPLRFASGDSQGLSRGRVQRSFRIGAVFRRGQRLRDLCVIFRSAMRLNLHILHFKQGKCLQQRRRKKVQLGNPPRKAPDRRRVSAFSQPCLWTSCSK